MSNNKHTELARQAVETYIKTGKIIPVPTNMPKEFYTAKAGVFVTIFKKDKLGGERLRGCIGTYLPTQKNLAREIISNAVSAASKDYRFGVIAKEELPDLEYEVSILNPLEQIKNLKELDPKKYGVLVKSIDGRSGLLLPDIKGIKTPAQQIAVACQKGEINPELDNIIIYRFTVEKYRE